MQLPAAAAGVQVHWGSNKEAGPKPLVGVSPQPHHHLQRPPAQEKSSRRSLFHDSPALPHRLECTTLAPAWEVVDCPVAPATAAAGADGIADAAASGGGASAGGGAAATITLGLRRRHSVQVASSRARGKCLAILHLSTKGLGFEA